MNFISQLQLAYEKISAAKRILIVGHTSPDADAIASMGAMIEVARHLNLEVTAYADNKASGAYDFIPNENLISSQAPDNLLEFEIILILDCGSLSRTALETRIRNLLAAQENKTIPARPYLMEFDHHEPNENYADLEIRLTDKAATAEIVYHFLKVNNLEITKTLANCILIGLLTDTGHFLHTNSSQEALAVSSEMLLRGASLPKIINKTIHNKSFAALKVWGRALENMKFNPDTGLASAGLTKAELENLLSPAEREQNVDLFSDIVSFLSYLSGVKVALLLREENGRVKGSLRTNYEEIDMVKIAKNWGGGGHKKAAGFSISGRLEKTQTGWKVI